jgi:N-acyl-D-amino-acid deacylase
MTRLPVILLLATPVLGADEAAIRAAVMKSLPLLERSSATAIEERSNCFTCHHTGLPVMTVAAARDRGFTIDGANLETQLKFTADFLAKNRANYLAGKGQGGAAFTAGSALWALKLGGRNADATTEAVVEYLLVHQKELDFWKPQTVRPPAEESAFSTTFVVIEGMTRFGTAAQGARIDRRAARVRRWLLETPARTTEDRVFKLMSLSATGADGEAIRRAREDLLHTQREDGGWAQLGDMSSDAYATGTALVALQRAAGAGAGDPACQRGLQWLLKEQLPDGSWHVVTRSKPVQKHFESGYPHGKDQFISITAACWATTALIGALPASR